MKKLAWLAALIACFSSMTACTSNQAIRLTTEGFWNRLVAPRDQEAVRRFRARRQNFRSQGFRCGEDQTGSREKAGITVLGISTPTDESLVIDFAFKDIRKLFSDKGDDGIISLTEQNGQSVFAFHLDRKNAKKMSELFSDASNPAFREMRPRKQRASTEKEYLEAIQFMSETKARRSSRARYRVPD